MKIKKILIGVIAMFICTTATVSSSEFKSIIESQKDSMGVNSFLDDAGNFGGSMFSKDDIEDVFSTAISGNLDAKKVTGITLKIFGDEFGKAISSLGAVIVVVLLNSLLCCLTNGLQEKSISKIVFYVQYILVVTVILKNFSEVINLMKDSIDNIVNFVNILLPLLISLVVTTGKIATASIMQPIILFMVVFMANFIKNVAIPIALISTALAIVSKISERAKVDKMAKRIKSALIWIIGVSLTLFVTIVSVDGTLSTGVDAVTSKTAKAAVSNMVPLVGKILGDAVDSVMGCGNILKNAVGVVGILIIVVISITPIVKLLIFMGVYYAISVICEPIADKKIIDLFEQTGDTFKILLALMSSLSVITIIGITLVIKISGNG